MDIFNELFNDSDSEGEFEGFSREDLPSSDDDSDSNSSDSDNSDNENDSKNNERNRPRDHPDHDKIFKVL